MFEKNVVHNKNVREKFNKWIYCQANISTPGPENLTNDTATRLQGVYDVSVSKRACAVHWLRMTRGAPERSGLVSRTTSVVVPGGVLSSKYCHAESTSAFGRWGRGPRRWLPPAIWQIWQNNLQNSDPVSHLARMSSDVNFLFVACE